MMMVTKICLRAPWLACLLVFGAHLGKWMFNPNQEIAISRTGEASTANLRTHGSTIILRTYLVLVPKQPDRLDAMPCHARPGHAAHDWRSLFAPEPCCLASAVRVGTLPHWYPLGNRSHCLGEPRCSLPLAPSARRRNPVHARPRRPHFPSVVWHRQRATVLAYARVVRTLSRYFFLF